MNAFVDDLYLHEQKVYGLQWAYLICIHVATVATICDAHGLYMPINSKYTRRHITVMFPFRLIKWSTCIYSFHAVPVSHVQVIN